MVSINYLGKKVDISVKRVGMSNTGLMFRTKNTDNLLFEFKEDADWKLTSLFVFFPFVAVFLDDKNKVLEIIVVKPFRFHIASEKPYNKLLEIPINEQNKKLVDFLVGEKSLNR